jgi:hypothetical protein
MATKRPSWIQGNQGVPMKRWIPVILLFVTLSGRCLGAANGACRYPFRNHGLHTHVALKNSRARCTTPLGFIQGTFIAIVVAVFFFSVPATFRNLLHATHQVMIGTRVAELLFLLLLVCMLLLFGVHVVNRE